MEDLLRAVVLGIVQGLTEFFPISSSGHLILTRELFGWEFSDDLTFDVALHLGTTVAVLAFFSREWLQMIRSLFSWPSNRSGNPGGGTPYDRYLLFLVVLGSLPTLVTGLVLNDFIEDNVRSPLVVGAMLLVFAAVLMASEALSRRRRNLASSNWRDALWIGCAQAISLIPGVSRSGVTMSAAMGRDFTHYDAAVFSFLLATPAILGAGLFKVTETVTSDTPREDIGVILVGTLVSAVVGWLSIRYLLRLLQTSSFLPFVAYRILAGTFVLIYFAV